MNESAESGQSQLCETCLHRATPLLPPPEGMSGEECPGSRETSYLLSESTVLSLTALEHRALQLAAANGVVWPAPCARLGWIFHAEDIGEWMTEGTPTGVAGEPPTAF